ncbi:nicotinamide riboside kinase 2-like isoform X1 [Homarus americanus]|uniref:nicotinamide riboside kinase 2-like isoform X1 n=1 Tax=Homarus americanus TaxID=6706 RepID=UPI001C472C2D|nr:nicotinamide riboside kinase 2-like isoform X1 [Homarus americanus]
MTRWLVVGISGATNSGKSTVTRKLLGGLPSTSRLICQDDYFYPEDSPHHIPCPGGVSHHNWEIISSLDMNKMMEDVLEIVESCPEPVNEAPVPKSVSNKISFSSCVSDYNTKDLPVLLLDGFLIFGHRKLAEMCDLRYFLTMTREPCWERRKCRAYDPPDPPGYFEHCVWPEYESHLKHVKESVPNVVFLNGMEDHYSTIYQQVKATSTLDTSACISKGQLLHYNTVVQGLERKNYTQL